MKSFEQIAEELAELIDSKYFICYGYYGGGREDVPMAKEELESLIYKHLTNED